MPHPISLSSPAASLRSGVSWLLLACAAVGALVILALFVDTLQQSVRRGEALREAQRSADTPQRAAMLDADNKRLAPRNYAVASQ